MGLYDTVHFTCPNCTATIAEQSKAGEACMKDYSSAEVPKDIAKSLKGTSVWCPDCEKEFVIVKVRTKLVPLKLINKDDYHE